MFSEAVGTVDSDIGIPEGKLLHYYGPFSFNAIKKLESLTIYISLLLWW